MVAETPPMKTCWTGTLGQIIPTLPHVSSSQRHSTQINPVRARRPFVVGRGARGRSVEMGGF
jgi:hypothetical protein